jgi:hypothetical protein
MSDVTVEFGAKDVGLSSALKQVQDEILGLKSQVKSGNLTLDQLEDTMRLIGQHESM